MLQTVVTAIVMESQALCRRGLVNLLEIRCGFANVLVAEDFYGLLAMLDDRANVSIVTLDGSLPSVDSLDCIRHLRYNYPQLRLVLVTTKADRSSALDALAAGVHGVVPKVLPESEMVKAFSMIASGGIFVPNLVSEVYGSVEKEAGLSDQEALVLTDRQREVLSLLAKGKSNKEIARALCIAEGTVKVHIAAAFKLLGVHNRVGAAAVLLSKLSVGTLPTAKQPVDNPIIVEQPHLLATGSE